MNGWTNAQGNDEQILELLTIMDNNAQVTE